jgi:hypothetical protein
MLGHSSASLSQTFIGIQFVLRLQECFIGAAVCLSKNVVKEIYSYLST